MSNISLELQCARDILQTYHRVHDDTPRNQSRLRPQPPQQKGSVKEPLLEKNREKELENEIRQLKEKYATLQNELSNRDERLEKLHHQLQERANNMARLQEDYENAIYQIAKRQGKS